MQKVEYTPGVFGTIFGRHERWYGETVDILLDEDGVEIRDVSVNSVTFVGEFA